MAADHDSLMKAEHELQRAQLANDANALNLLLHDQLRFVGPDGAIHDKAEDLSVHEAGLVAFKTAKPVEIEAHVFGTTGVSIALIDLELEVNGNFAFGGYRYTLTWLYEDDRWQVVAGSVVSADHSRPSQ